MEAAQQNLILQQDTPSDYIIATGCTSSLRDFVRLAFEHVGLNWQDHVQRDESLLRPSDLMRSELCTEKVEKQLGWKARSHIADVVKMMIDGCDDVSS